MDSSVGPKLSSQKEEVESIGDSEICTVRTTVPLACTTSTTNRVPTRLIGSEEKSSSIVGISTISTRISTPQLEPCLSGAKVNPTTSDLDSTTTCWTTASSTPCGHTRVDSTHTPSSGDTPSSSSSFSSSSSDWQYVNENRGLVLCEEVGDHHRGVVQQYVEHHRVDLHRRLEWQSDNNPTTSGPDNLTTTPTHLSSSPLPTNPGGTKTLSSPSLITPPPSFVYHHSSSSSSSFSSSSSSVMSSLKRHSASSPLLTYYLEERPVSSCFDLSTCPPCKCCYSPLFSRGHLAVLAGVLIHLTLGTLYTWGNMSGYIVSYIRHQTILHYSRRPGQFDPMQLVRIKDSAWVFSALFAGQAIGMPLGGFTEKRTGPKIATSIGCLIMFIGLNSSQYFLYSFPLFTLLYGFLYGFGLGFAYTCPMVCALKWFPQRQGLTSGFITAGFGAGALLFNLVQTQFINATNIPPVEFAKGERYFESEAVLNNIPSAIHNLSIIYVGLQIIGILLICSPSSVGQNKTMQMQHGRDRCMYCSTNSSTPVLQHTNHDTNSTMTAATSSSQHPSTMTNKWNEKTPLLPTALSTKTLLLPVITPGVGMGSPRFYLLLALFLMNGLSIAYTATFWKTMGIGGGISDRSLTIVGSVGSLFNALGRIVWGAVADRHSCRTAIMFMSGIWCLAMGFFPLAVHYGTAVYVITVCLNFFCLGGNFSLFPTATAKAFGREYFGPIYGLIYFSQLVASLSVAFLAQKLALVIGDIGLTLIIASFSMVTASVCFWLPKFGCDMDRRITV